MDLWQPIVNAGVPFGGENCGTGVGGFQRGNKCATGKSSRVALEPNFKEWFGNSQVVDDSGHPLIVYHGSSGKDFTKYKFTLRKDEQLGFGIHFSEDSEFAGRYAIDPDVSRKKTGGRVYPVYLKIENMLDADSIVKEGSPEYKLAKKLAGTRRIFPQLDENGISSLYLQSVIDLTSPERAERIIRESGYDGVRYQARVGRRMIRGIQETGRSTSYIVFNPNQVRSAISGGEVWNAWRVLVNTDCGTGYGGFKSGNTCAKSGIRSESIPTNVVIEHGHTESIRKLLKQFSLTPKDVAELTGSLGANKMTLSSVNPNGTNPAILATTSHKDYNSSIAVYKDHVYIAWFESRNTGKGVGMKVFADIVGAGIERGVDYISLEAAKSEEMNGYYTWARLGFDGMVDGPSGGYRDTPVSDLMKTKSGREWWKRHGHTYNGEFDLKEGSLSRRIFEAYLEEKKL